MSLIDVFSGKYLMDLRALVWRVWSLAEMFWHGEMVGMKALFRSNLI